MVDQGFLPVLPVRRRVCGQQPAQHLPTFSRMPQTTVEPPPVAHHAQARSARMGSGVNHQPQHLARLLKEAERHQSHHGRAASTVSTDPTASVSQAGSPGAHPPQANTAAALESIAAMKRNITSLRKSLHDVRSGVSSLGDPEGVWALLRSKLAAGTSQHILVDRGDLAALRKSVTHLCTRLHLPNPDGRAGDTYLRQTSVVLDVVAGGEDGLSEQTRKKVKELEGYMARVNRLMAEKEKVMESMAAGGGRGGDRSPRFGGAEGTGGSRNASPSPQPADGGGGGGGATTAAGRLSPRPPEGARTKSSKKRQWLNALDGKPGAPRVAPVPAITGAGAGGGWAGTEPSLIPTKIMASPFTLHMERIRLERERELQALCMEASGPVRIDSGANDDGNVLAPAAPAVQVTVDAVG